MAHQQPGEQLSVRGDDPIAEFNGPDKRRKHQHSGAPPSQRFQNEQACPASSQDLAVGFDDMNGALASSVQPWSHRRPWGLLIRQNLELMINVFAPDPGDNPTAKVSGTVPENPVSFCYELVSVIELTQVHGLRISTALLKLRSKRVHFDRHRLLTWDRLLAQTIVGGNT